MKAKFKNTNHVGKIRQNRKEDKFTNQISAVVETPATYPGAEPFTQAVEARFYWTASRCYCCLWVQAEKYYVSGGGYAGGYGYDKDSAALRAACDDAGIELSEPIAGRGRSASEDAIRAICKAATGKRKIAIVRAHA